MMAAATSIGGPLDAHGVRSADAYRAAHAQYMAALRDHFNDSALGPHDISAPIVARIDHGRWIVDCATEHCANAPSASPEWGIACCYECGAVYTAIEFPANRLLIEQVLVQRPMAARNWSSHETLTELVMENATHEAEV